MKAAIFGAGAMGTVLGAFITAAGKEVDLISRNRTHISSLKERGAQISGGVNFCVKVNALTPEEVSERYSVIFLMTKQSGESLDFLNDFLEEEGVVCTLQNGLPERAVAEAVGEDRCLGCSVSWGATFTGSGKCELTSKRNKMTFALGSIKGGAAKTQAVKEYLSCAGKVTVTENSEGARWAKLAINCAFSSLSAICGMTFGEVGKNKITRRVALEILNEVFAVAEKSGVRLEKIQGHRIDKLFSYKSAFKKRVALVLLPLAMHSHKKLVSGMYFDLKAGKPCEIDFMNGAVCSAAEKVGAHSPLNAELCKIAHEIEQGKRKICFENVFGLR
ncbi:MAG: 2-dehydropantoate 2-reductase [Clostridia bacterium]|nr:2-dehydropantoate 2-reductase [Clostridia bacterium]